MAFAFDSLGYAKHLRDNGVSQPQAEAHAEAARQFIMAELVTRIDLEVVRRDLDTSIQAVRHDLDVFRREIENKMDTLSLRLTVRMGVLLAAGLSILGVVLKLH
jgi:hypothetical protein